MLLRDATYMGDEEHLDFFGGRSLPVMLACPSRTLEVMPYALAARTEDAGLCVCDLQVGRRAGGQGPGPGRAMLHERFTLFVLQNTAVTTYFYMGTTKLVHFEILAPVGIQSPVFSPPGKAVHVSVWGVRGAA